MSVINGFNFRLGVQIVDIKNVNSALNVITNRVPRAKTSIDRENFCKHYLISFIVGLDDTQIGYALHLLCRETFY